jgi:translation initiation factor 1 (eIF-1/SUI1)
MDTKESQKINTTPIEIDKTITTNYLKGDSPKGGKFAYQNADDSSSDSDDEEKEDTSEASWSAPEDEEDEDASGADQEANDDETFEEMTHVNFALEQEQNTVITVVTIFATQNGRKRNTYIIGLENSQEEQLTFLRTMKRKYGCNGSMKVVAYEGIDVPAIHLQGDQIKKAKAFLAEQNILNVVVKDLIV